jgi:type IV secretory pathway VirB10-like protein
MVIIRTGCVFAALFVFSLFPSMATAQSVPLTVQPGTALDIALKKPVRVKSAGTPVEGRLENPIYVFDRIVIPAGSQVQGRVASVEHISKGRRALAIANGDFTPFRKANVEFDAVILPDGSKIPLQTTVSEGVPDVVHLSAGGNDKKKGRVSTTVSQAEQSAKQQAHQAMDEIKAPGKWSRLKAAMLAELPYRRQSLPIGTRFTAELTRPLDFGSTEPRPGELAPLGTQIPPGNIVHVLLLTELSSATDRVGAPVRAVVSEPVFSSNGLVLPAGATLQGSVTQVTPARQLHRNGKLRFSFRQVDVTGDQPRRVEATLEGIDASAGAHMKLDDEGGASAVTPKTNMIAPAIDVVLASTSLDGLDPHRRLHPHFHQGPDTLGGSLRGGAGFGLVGSLIGLAAHYRPVSATFAFYGAGWSVYTHFLARGTDVVFAKDTPMEIGFGTHQSLPPPVQGPKVVPTSAHRE